MSMKLRISQRKQKKKEKPTAFIKLEEDSDGDITILLCDINGRKIGSLITLKTDGTLHRYSRMTTKREFEEFGFKFDDCDRIKDSSGDC